MHPLASAPHSFKELLTHIGIVTIGILIALSLEGIIQTVHDHSLLRDTRENFRVEVEADLRQMDQEIVGVEKANHATHEVIADLLILEKNPAGLKQRIDALYTNGYTISSSAWAGALSSGALPLMNASEVMRYANFDSGVRMYTGLEDRAVIQQDELHSYVDSRRSFGSQEIEEVEDKLRNYEMLTHTMEHVGTQVRDDMNKTLR